MANATLKREPAASANKVPTLHTIHNVKRSVSYSPAQNGEHAAAARAAESTRGCDHMVKSALTELLNDDGVKSNARGSRSVQNMLMQNEKKRKSQRRQSLLEQGNHK
ncbi:uncharacterized protein BO66DRAFT_394846 [Aspergillus aculeatinus CBS 121060]|uniref:Uncharacterized protein n=6 Tax=Aspergillus TaxID=5052 RepID=A0A319CP49_9EURO|nr:hypothetical protein BO95DRAFT_440501 [Aspergillus brunneoviolaceus CBS 621.78]XP_025497416.1 hypothetical protein BO82DRAFT_360311 [Aspergillus uvarum CBS 121591]XP_025499975.1 hypothetical protein BO66DRAFT_394846 [Aspergillus aculeatinus CBS 121060]XP_025533407.1 hypothetical protein BO86DRAFT_394311 [Aspergillus japonicus CBS 114.51]XP_040802273.1 uncharacterized protein BO72DRAFT_447311 [Aspergillus fijiensis CBS 313.89]PYI19319.1 hypothetical protein BO99DRAFT_333155 [Aspergillus viol